VEEKEFLDWLNSFTDAQLAWNTLLEKPESFRINTLKVSNNLFEEFSSIPVSRVKWFDSARVLEQKISLGKTIEYFLGYIHPQSISSMVPPLILSPKENEMVLDLTAAPGSKTTQISALMKNTGMIVANDEPDREVFIVNNLARLGALNVLVTNRDAKRWPLRGIFDKVLLDAPCSALGSNPNAIRRFSENEVKKIASVQKDMIIRAFDALKPNGVLVYSTCTYTKQENEEVVSHLLNCREEAKLESITLKIPHSSGLDSLQQTWRIYPQHLGSEGFFIAKISKVY